MTRHIRDNSRVILAALIVGLAFPAAVFADSLNVAAYREDAFPDSDKGVWSLRLRFNHPVFASDLVSSTEAIIEGKNDSFSIQNPQTDKTADGALREFRIVSAKAPPPGATVQIRIREGLKDDSGRRSLAAAFLHQFAARGNRIDMMGFSKFVRSHNERGILLSFSQDVSPEDAKRAITISPEVPNLVFGRGVGPKVVSVAGDFEVGRQYQLEISGIDLPDGRSAFQQRRVGFEGPGTPSLIALKTNRNVIELKSRQLAPMKLQKVKKARVSLKRIPPYLFPELAETLASGSALKDDQIKGRLNALTGLAKGGKINPVFVGEASEDSEIFFAGGAEDGETSYSLPLSFRKNPDRGGIWHARFEDADSASTPVAASLLQITDLSIGFKWSAGSLLVWVTSIHTGEPISGANLILADKEGVEFFAGKTDARGLLVVKDNAQLPAIGRGGETAGPSAQTITLANLKWAIAATAADCSAIDMTAQRFKSFSVKQMEDINESSEAISAYIFTERGIYRPGETVFFKLVARAYRDQQVVAPEGEKARVEIIGPKQETHYGETLELNEFGSCHGSFALKPFFPVGQYTIKAWTNGANGDKPTASAIFSVQEYKRPRHYVSASAKEGAAVSQDYVGLKQEARFLTIHADAKYYTGGPVKHTRARWKAMLVPVTQKVKGLDGFFFGNSDKEERFLESGESMMDAEGKLEVTLPLDQRLLTGLYGVKTSITVLDVDGEPATDVVTYSPQPRYCVGVSRHPEQVQAGYSASFKVAAVAPDGRRVSRGEISGSLLKKQFFYSEKRDQQGNISFMYEMGWMKTVATSQPIVNGEASYTFELVDPGEYMLSFTYAEGNEKFTSQTVLQVGWQDYENWLRQKSEAVLQTSNEILPTTSRKEYQVGDLVSVEFHFPRRVTKCLVALEKGDVVDYKLIDVNGRKGKFEFTASAEHRPNVFVSVLGAAGREGFPVYTSQTDADVPTVYFGYADVKVRSELEELKVKIEPDKAELKGRPGEKTSLKFRVTGQKGKGALAELAVCVVDEAVLALTRFKTPELSSLVDFRAALGVFSGDLRLALVSQDPYRIFGTKPLTGGGFGPGFVGPTVRKDFRPVAYFNPALKTDESGEAEVEFNLPDSSTAYRVYVAACDKRVGFASAQREMVVSKEFVLEPSTPRFLIPGDKVVFPVVLYNRTADQGEATIKAEGSKGLEVGLESASATVAPHSTGQVEASASASRGAEAATLLVRGDLTTKSGKFDDAIERSFPIRSRYMPARRVKPGSFRNRTEIAIDLPAGLKNLKPEEVNPNDFSARLSLSTTDWNKITPGLKYLLAYPYGCVEQTSSGIIPLAGLRSMVKSGMIPGVKIEEVDRFLEKGVARLLSMQQDHGGFSYWPGQMDFSWWSTLYATSALVAVGQAGFEVPQSNMERALNFIRGRLFAEGAEYKKQNAAWTKELALYILAANGKATAAELKPFFSGYDAADDHAKALLLMAAKSVRYMSDEEIGKRVAQLQPKVDPSRCDYYNSSYRTLAMCLMAAVHTKGAEAKADHWAGELLRGVHPEGRWYSTADTGWCLLGLGKYYSGKDHSKQATVPAKVRASGDAAMDVTVSKAATELDLDFHKLLEHGKITIESPSNELISYTVNLTFPDVAADPSELEKGFTLRKTMQNLSGKEEIRVGDIVRITLDIHVSKALTGHRWGSLEYVALEDPVPAGLVPINSDLETEGAMREKGKSDNEITSEGYVQAFHPSHAEFREDGVRVFKNRIWTGSFRYTYLARAAAQGEFWMPGSRISLMYNPDSFGKTLGRALRVLPADKAAK